MSGAYINKQQVIELQKESDHRRKQLTDEHMAIWHEARISLYADMARATLRDDGSSLEDEELGAMMDYLVFEGLSSEREALEVLHEVNVEPTMTPYAPSLELCYIIESDGDSWFAHYNTFTNVQESDEVAFGSTPQEALQKFIDRRVIATQEDDGH